MKKSEINWHKQRAKGIGGSDCAAILGKNPYMTNVELWEIKTGRKKQQDISDKDCVKFGVAAEQHLRELFKLDYPEFEVIYEPYNNNANPQYDFIRGSFDGRLIEKSTNKKGILEIKTTNILQSMQKEKWNDQIPDNYFCQILHYFLVDPTAEFAILKARLRYQYENEVKATIRHYFFDRNDYKEDLNFLLTEERKVWDSVVNDRRPDLILPPL